MRLRTIIAVALAAATMKANADNLEYRLVTKAGGEVASNTTVFVETQDRFKEHDHYFVQRAVGLEYKLNDSFSLAGKYVDQEIKQTESDVFVINPQFQTALGSIRLALKGHGEYDTKSDQWIFRNRLQASRKVGMTKPYLFYQLIQSENLDITENRFGLGIGIRLGDFSLGIEDAYRNKKDNKDNHMIGLKIGYKW
ncbi:DUF2490 domain-containing protein [Candidatus Woesearchaeota archaeon]|nr:DUF2490 domain-containing protein [Candidatus Woesearchaeota archaeon]